MAERKEYCEERFHLHLDYVVEVTLTLVSFLLPYLI